MSTMAASLCDEPQHSWMKQEPCAHTVTGGTDRRWSTSLVAELQGKNYVLGYASG
jgi:hypothetical protein